ncbi:MAG: FkbM family methyltransferase, partial [Candidatus Dadabacteria bacterium]|nr:FkbM family methyltransferase [Candidatus Dadabacteria bacterium]
MTTTEYGHGRNSLSEVPDMGDGKNNLFNQAITAYAIDDFIAKYNLSEPQHIKLDVDGIEPEILKGGTNTLRKIKSMMIEVEHENAENF